MLELMSLFGSTFFSLSMANLPLICVHVEECGGGGVRVYNQKVGIKEQFKQMSMGKVGQNQEECGLCSGGGVRVYDQKVGIEEQFAQMSTGQIRQKQEEGGFIVLFSLPPMPTTIVTSVMPTAVPRQSIRDESSSMMSNRTMESLLDIASNLHLHLSHKPSFLLINIFVHFPSIRFNCNF